MLGFILLPLPRLFIAYECEFSLIQFVFIVFLGEIVVKGILVAKEQRLTESIKKLVLVINMILLCLSIEWQQINLINGLFHLSSGIKRKYLTKNVSKLSC